MIHGLLPPPPPFLSFLSFHPSGVASRFISIMVFFIILILATNLYNLLGLDILKTRLSRNSTWSGFICELSQKVKNLVNLSMGDRSVGMVSWNPIVFPVAYLGYQLVLLSDTQDSLVFHISDISTLTKIRKYKSFNSLYPLDLIKVSLDTMCRETPIIK